MSALAAMIISLTGMACYGDVAEEYELPVGLLYAMAEQESAFDTEAIAYANNGTFSVGLMQINSSWFPALKARGIDYDDLDDGCTNLEAGAWILKQEVDRYGRNWEAIGAYYAGAYTDKTKKWKIKHYKEYATGVLAKWRAIELRAANAPTVVAVAKPAA